MREDPLDVLLRVGLEDVINPPEEREDYDLAPVRLARRQPCEGWVKRMSITS